MEIIELFFRFLSEENWAFSQKIKTGHLSAMALFNFIRDLVIWEF